jgi:NAD(P)-dependent dehydrogenase (short-subunit alcohol dehydrogenase family)
MGTRLEGKTALVTGATSNIGRAIALAFGAQGARVVVSGRSAERGALVVEQIRAGGGRADFVRANLDGSAKASADLATEARRVLGGRVEILVNNAGIFPRSTTATTDEATFDEVYAVNVKAPYFLTGAIAPAMADAGQGAIINLGSWIARLGIASALYSSTKGAVETLTGAWAAEFGPAGVRSTRFPPALSALPIPTGPMAAGTPLNR